MDNTKTPLSVAHSMFIWLPLTAIWLYNHIKSMEHVHSIILTRQLHKPEQFPWEPIYATNKQQQFLYKAGKRVGFRWHPANFHNAIQSHSVKILHSHFGDVGWFDIPFAAKHQLKHVVTFYGLDVNMLPTKQPVWRKRYQRLFKEADLFLCEGPFMAQSLVALGCPQDKVLVHRLGVEVNKIPYVPRKLVPGEPLKILIAGTFREKKGIPYALEAVGELYQNGTDVEVTVIGDSNGFAREEAEKRRILDVIERFQMESIIRMLGYQPYDLLLAEAYEHHVFLSPSVTASDGDTEGGAPVTLIDLMASGMPIVSTTHCDIPQIVENGRTGLLAEERNIEGLVRSLKWLVDNLEKWEEMTYTGRRHVETAFDVQIQARGLIEIYKGLLG